MSNATEIPSIVQEIQQTAAQQGAGDYLIYIIAGIAILMALIILKSRKSKSNKKQIAIIGERGSGKTQLFIGLSGGKPFETVPSIVNNTCEINLGRNKYILCDFIGDNLSKQQTMNQIARFHTIVHVIDGTDSKKLGDAALFIYKALVNKQFQKDPCNYLLFLNKSDLTGFHGLEKLVKRIEDQVETIKVTRRSQSDQNEQGEEDYLRKDRTRFDLKRQGIEIVVGSARSNRSSIIAKLQEVCG